MITFMINCLKFIMNAFHSKTKYYKIYQNKYKSWLTPFILNSINKKRLYKKSLQSKTLNSKIKYINYKNKLTTVIRNSEKLYYKNKFDNLKGNIRETWQLINKILRENSHQLHQCFINEIISDGIIVKDHFLIASIFNKFFINKGSDLAKKNSIFINSYVSN